MTKWAEELDRSQPMVRQIQHMLREKIRSGDLRAGTKLPSMRQLSADFGCSLGIVKQAVNTLAAQGYLRSSPRRGVFVADATPQAREIVLILPHLEIERLHLAVMGVRAGLAESGHRISIHAGEDSTTSDHNGVPSYLNSPNVAGVMLLLPSAGEHPNLAETLGRQGIPTVIVDITARTAAADVVSIDPIETGRRGAQHLIERGHQSLLLIESVGDARLPFEIHGGVELALKEAGLDPAGLTRLPIDRSRTREPGAWRHARSAAADILAAHPEITGIIGVGPQLTLGGYQAARDVGRRIPKDMSVLGLLGDSSALQAMEPAVTIFDNPLKEVCQQAAERLLARIDGLSAQPERLGRLPDLIERGSVAAAPER